MDSKVTVLPRKDKVNWLTTSIMLLLHTGAVAALFMFSWKNLIVSALLYWMAIGFGIGMGYHRLLTHRSYKVPRFIEYFFAVCGVLTLEGGPIFWVATHRLHHQHADRDLDPHTPRHGGFWAHVGWIIFGDRKHDDTVRMSKYAPDLSKDRFYVWLNNYHWVPILAMAVILYWAGGVSLMLWGTCLRIVIGLHATWLVNSATHMWGGQRFATRDDSRNSWWVALLTFGEGWHNNHHAHPTSARHGLAWYEFDLTWIQIWTLKMLGIAKAVKVAELPDDETKRAAA